MSLKSLIKDKVRGIPGKRSNQWPAVRAEFLKTNPTCRVCNGVKSLEVHHKQPFHHRPDLELEPANLITLCEAKKNGANCHLLFGHLGNFKSINVNVVQDAASWRDKISHRPD